MALDASKQLFVDTKYVFWFVIDLFSGPIMYGATNNKRPIAKVFESVVMFETIFILIVAPTVPYSLVQIVHLV